MKNKFNLVGIFAIFILVVLGCSSSSNQKVSSNDSLASSLVPSQAATLLDAGANRDYPRKIQSKSATVITENANLRQTATVNGKVIDALPQDTNVEIIRQKGAWFYVRALDQTGWLHGNTIRMVEDNPADYSIPSPNKSTSPGTSSRISTKTTNSTGASARCADGTLSYSRHRRGTCSHHGGVADWL